MWKRLMHPQRTFAAGMLLVLPLLVTIWLLRFLFELLEGLGVSALIEAFAGHKIPGLGTAITLAFIFLLGLAAGSMVGRRILQGAEDLLLRIPLVRSIYGPARRLLSVLGREDAESQEVVLVEYPRPGLFMVGFVTHRDAESVSVFLPTAPNPTSGFLVVCKAEETRPTRMTFPDAMSLIVSGGVVRPEPPLRPFDLRAEGRKGG